MRIRARGLHKGPARESARTYFAALAATVAALLAVLGFTGTFASASVAAPVRVMLDRAAENPAYVMDDSQIRTEIGQIAVQARIRAAARAAAVLAAHTYTVRSGESLSSVAAKRCGQARMWTGIYAASRAHRWTGQNANQLNAGQHLYLSCAYVPSMLRFAPAPPPPPVVQAAVVSAVRTSGHHAYRVYHRSYSAPAATYHGGSGYEACVIARESGGQTQVMNSSGHYGLFQFDYGTWVSGGGAGADFGHASVTEQQRVFSSVYAARGTQPWSPSDGC